MNYLEVIEVLRKLESDTREIQIEEKLVSYKRDLLRKRKDAIKE